MMMKLISACLFIFSNLLVMHVCLFLPVCKFLHVFLCYLSGSNETWQARSHEGHLGAVPPR